MLNNVRFGKKILCSWKNCKDKFKFIVIKEVSKILLVIKRLSCKVEYLRIL